MNIIDHYLKTLKSGLPAAHRDDIVRELSESIFSEIQEKEAELGRPLGEAEVETLLRQRGNPLVLASRYRPDERSLSFGRQIIGPTFFPYYARVLKFNLGLTGVVILIIFAALLAGGKSLGLGDALRTLFWNLLLQFLVITGIFWAMDRHLSKHPDRWDIGKVSRAHFPELEASIDGPRVPRMDSVSQLIGLMVFLVWLRAVRTLPFLIFGPAASFLTLAPVWRQLYTPVVLIALLGMAQSGLNLVRPDWVRLCWLVQVATHAANLVICLFLIRAGVWVMAVDGVSAGYRQAVTIVNQVIFYSLWVVAAITVVTLWRALRRLIRGTGRTIPGKAAANS
jgi:hypothetical protein